MAIQTAILARVTVGDVTITNTWGCHTSHPRKERAEAFRSQAHTAASHLSTTSNKHSRASGAPWRKRAARESQMISPKPPSSGATRSAAATPAALVQARLGKAPSLLLLQTRGSNGQQSGFRGSHAGQWRTRMGHEQQPVPSTFPWWLSRVVVPRASPPQHSPSTLQTSRSLAETKLPRLKRLRVIWCQIWVNSLATKRRLSSRVTLPAAQTAAAPHQQHPTHSLGEENLHSSSYSGLQTGALKRSELYKDRSRGAGCSLCSLIMGGGKNTNPINTCCTGEQGQLG